MTSVRIISLYSGSTGNCFVISAPCGTLLIDAGKNAKRLHGALAEVGIDADSIGAILVTHEHTDHISALPVFLKKHPVPVHIANGSAYKLLPHPSVEPLLHTHPPIYEESICGMRVVSFPTPHDSRASVGYRIEIPCEDGTVYRIGYATDIGYVTPEIEEALTGCYAVILESNHDYDMLMTGPYPYDLKMRIASRRGHLSNPDSAALAARLCAAGTKKLMLAHLSQENNAPDIALGECIGALGDADVQVFVAHPEIPTEML